MCEGEKIDLRCPEYGFQFKADPKNIPVPGACPRCNRNVHMERVSPGDAATEWGSTEAPRDASSEKAMGTGVARGVPSTGPDAHPPADTTAGSIHGAGVTAAGKTRRAQE